MTAQTADILSVSHCHAVCWHPVCVTVTLCADILSVSHCRSVCWHPVSVTLSRCVLTSCLCRTVTLCAGIRSVSHCHAVCRHPVCVTLSRCGHIYSSRPPIPTIFFPDVYLSQSSIYIHLPFFPLHISY